MQRPQDSRVDLADLKQHIVKKIGVERSRRYFYYLGRFLSQKLTKSEFDKSCYRLMGRENLSLHNRLIRSILRNASLAKSPPPVHKTGQEDGPEHQSGFLIPNHNRNGHVWSNGVVSSGTCGPNGKVESLLHQPLYSDDKSSNRNMENGDLGPFAYQRSGRYPDEREAAFLGKGPVSDQVSRDDEAQEKILSTGPVIAPLGIPFCSASIGGTRKTVPVLSSNGLISCYDSGGLSETEMMRKRMENIAVAHGLGGGVSAECPSTLNNMLDMYLKKLIKSCIDLAGARSMNGTKVIENRVRSSNNLHIQTSNQLSDLTQEEHSVSLLDFRVAMELNPHQLGEDWPLLRERVSVRSFEEREGV